MANKNRGVHVVPDHSNGRLDWQVKTEGTQRAYRTLPNKSEAEALGRQVAINNSAELFIHNKDGKIAERNSYGNDPFPPRG